MSEFNSGSIRKIVGPKELPLQWLSMSASLTQNNKALIQWQVKEKNVQQYQILKSKDVQHFVPIANIKSQGNGTNKYSYVEQQSLYNTTYYRILQTDENGSQVQSGTMVLSNFDQNIDALSVYPTISSENIHIESGANQTIRIINAMGVEALQQTIQRGHTNISLQNLATGIYYLHSSNGSVQLIEKI